MRTLSLPNAAAAISRRRIRLFFRGLFFLYLLTVIALIPYFVGNHVYGDCLMYIANYDLGSDGDIQQALYVFGFDHDVLSEPTFCEYYKVGLITIF